MIFRGWNHLHPSGRKIIAGETRRAADLDGRSGAKRTNVQAALAQAATTGDADCSGCTRFAWMRLLTGAPRLKRAFRKRS